MKILRNLILMTVLLTICSVLSASAAAGPELTVSATEFDFGTVPKGEPVTYTFEIKNTGDSPLIISEVTKPCGCQKAEHSKEPIAPGETGFVKATYNAAKTGSFVKAFTVNHNGEKASTKLVLRGKVTENQDAAKPLIQSEDPGH